VEEALGLAEEKADVEGEVEDAGVGVTVDSDDHNRGRYIHNMEEGGPEDGRVCQG